MSTLSTAEQFFYEHAGSSYDPATQTAEEGRLEGARQYAAAEEAGRAAGWWATTEDDPDVMDDDAGTVEKVASGEWVNLVVQLWGQADGESLIGGGPVLLGSLGAVTVTSPSDPYVRVVAAELAAERLAEAEADAYAEAGSRATDGEGYPLERDGRVVWACCESTIGGPCGHRVGGAALNRPAMPTVPDDFPVRPLDDDEPARDRMKCGTCGRSWDDAVSTSWTPVPSGRCPFEYYHPEESESDRVGTLAEIVQEWADQGEELQAAVDRMAAALERLSAPPMTDAERAAVAALIEG